MSRRPFLVARLLLITWSHLVWRPDFKLKENPMRLLRLISKFLNSAFGLWLLSSVVLGVFLSIASEEQRCYSTAKTILPKIAKTASERDLRILAISTVIHSNKPTSETLTAIRGITNGTTYFYQDYKGTSLMDLEFILIESSLEIESLRSKEASRSRRASQ